MSGVRGVACAVSATGAPAAGGPRPSGGRCDGLRSPLHPGWGRGSAASGPAGCAPTDHCLHLPKSRLPGRARGQVPRVPRDYLIAHPMSEQHRADTPRAPGHPCRTAHICFRKLLRRPPGPGCAQPLREPARLARMTGRQCPSGATRPPTGESHVGVWPWLPSPTPARATQGPTWGASLGRAPPSRCVTPTKAAGHRRGRQARTALPRSTSRSTSRPSLAADTAPAPPPLLDLPPPL